MAAVSDTAASGTATSAGKGVEISKAIFNAIAIFPSTAPIHACDIGLILDILEAVKGRRQVVDGAIEVELGMKGPHLGVDLLLIISRS
jgi:hypothetical protein